MISDINEFLGSLQTRIKDTLNWLRELEFKINPSKYKGKMFALRKINATKELKIENNEFKWNTTMHPYSLSKIINFLSF